MIMRGKTKLMICSILLSCLYRVFLVFRFYDGRWEAVNRAINMCLNALSQVDRDYYHDLALFPADVNIKPEILEILWNKDKYEVRKILNQFVNKSLIISFYHKDMKTYIYGIHKLHANYLKNVTTEQKAKELHTKLISCYRVITNDSLDDNLADWPDNDYMLTHIGYHLKEAGDCLDDFQIYFDFKFLQKKIRIVSVGDVLDDMDKYRTCITKGVCIIILIVY